jgi:hypothetical protein
MNSSVKRLVAVGALAMIGAAGMASHASAFNLRVPQVVVGGASLQTYLNSKGESINVQTDQVNAQIWSTSASGNSVFTLMIELAGNAAGNAIGVYNANDAVPALFEVFPGAAAAGWHAMISFQSSGNLVVTLFDNNSAIIGQNTYLNVDKNAFGFYLAGPGGTFYSQDGRNAGSVPQMLTYAGTGVNFGEWWFCFEDLTPAGGSDNDFEDAIVILESVVPLATKAVTFGGVKGLYR